MKTTFVPPTWAVPGLLPEGLSVLVGPPKIGKSWLALNIAVAVARGHRVLGKIDADAGPVLYLALEDTGVRLQQRVGKVLGGGSLPPVLDFWTEVGPSADKVREDIALWMETHPDARLVVVDVFAKVRTPPPPGAQVYQADYDEASRLKAIADRHGVPLLLVHHTRKQEAQDFVDGVSGSRGITGAADTILSLTRGREQADGALKITGRDVEEQTRALMWSRDAGTWTLLDGDATEHLVGDTRRTILRHLRDHPGQGPTAIAEATGIKLNTVKQTVGRMKDDHQLTSDRGSYSLPVTPVTGVTFAGRDRAAVSPRLSPDDHDVTDDEEVDCSGMDRSERDLFDCFERQWEEEFSAEDYPDEDEDDE